MQKVKAVLWTVLLLCSFSAESVSIIKNIRYEGNEVTQTSVLNREIYISEGDVLDDNLVEKSRQAIMDLGLFKTVHYYLEGQYIIDASGEKSYQLDVVFVVEEKYYLLIIPRLKIDDDELYYGVQLRWDNVWGLNHKIRMLVEDRGTTQGIDENRNEFRYFYPNIKDTAYSAGFILQEINEVDESQGIIDRQDDLFQVSVSRWLNQQGHSRGWFAGGSLLYQQRFNDVLSGGMISEEIDAIVLGMDLGFRDINTFEFNRGGKAYGYKLNWSHESVGSEAEFAKHQFYYKSYYRFDNYPLSNLNVQTQFGHSNNEILGEPAFSLGSSDDLRGYENNRFEGNTMFLTNVEFMFPQDDYPVIRYVYFIDVGNTYDDISDVLHESLNVGAGLGLRWKIRAFVKLDLRADVGYGFTDSDYRFSFGTRHAF